MYVRKFAPPFLSPVPGPFSGSPQPNVPTCDKRNENPIHNFSHFPCTNPRHSDTHLRNCDNMTTAEEQELLAQINRLEGRISRHKAQHAAPTSSYPRSTYRSSPYHRGAPRGSRGHAPTYRNRTLVLNGQNGQSAQARPDSPASANTNGSWVSRTDRHLQLINSSVFEKDSQARASAIEETQRQKRLQKEQMEKSRFLHYVQKNGSSMPPLPSNSAPATSAASKYEITVEGIRFQITKQGSKLVRAPGKLALVPIPSISSTYLATRRRQQPSFRYSQSHHDWWRQVLSNQEWQSCQTRHRQSTTVCAPTQRKRISNKHNEQIGRWNQEGQHSLQDLLLDRYCLLQLRFITKITRTFWTGVVRETPDGN